MGGAGGGGKGKAGGKDGKAGGKGAKKREDKGSGKGKASKDASGAKSEAPNKIEKAPPESEPGPDADAEGVEDGEGKVTRALVEALRAFSAPHWWLIGRKEGKEAEVPIAARKRMKPEEFQQKCSERHAQMRKVYESTMMQDSEQRWLRKVSSEGTAGDKVASMTMLIQVCPVFATGYIKALLTMAGKTSRSDSMMALDSLKELFTGTLLPDRKLKTFNQMDPISPKGLSKIAFTELSVVAFFEDFLKTCFAGFVHVLSEAAHSSVTFFKTKSMRTAFELLSTKPEQERALLGLLVNKFGDHASKVSSNASFHMKKLVEAHPGMKGIVSKEVESFLARPNITTKSQYCAVLHLSEMVLSRKVPQDGEVAALLVRIFVARLEAALRGPVKKPKVKGPKGSGKGGGKGKGDRNRWWRPKEKRVRHGGLQDEDNRLVRTLINGIQRALPYLDTTADSSPLQEETLNALFKVCHTVSSFSTRIAILSLLWRHLFERTRGEPPNRFYQLLHEQLAQFDLFGSTHRQQAFLLLQRCIPADISVSRALAMSRRLLQVGASSAPPVAVAALAVLRDLFTARRHEMMPLLQSVDSELKVEPDLENDDVDEEHFVDDDVAQAPAKTEAKAEEERPRYEPAKRDPRYAKARYTPLWELYALRSHVHPFVAHGASQLLQAESFLDVSTNPFDSFATGEMLEEFVLSSRAQRGSKKDRNQEKEGKLPRVSFTTERFSKKKNVSPHERFIQLYYKDSTVMQKQRLKDSKKREAESDVDEEGGGSGGEDKGDEEDKFFDTYLEGQMPKGGSEDEGDDEDPDMDDDSAFDDDSAAGGSDADADPLREEGEEAGDGDGSDDDDDDEDEAPAKGGKRKAETMPERAKRIKAIKKKHSGSMFASAEDFASLLDGENFDD
mmetsp:Transcript_8173/g.22604  ORF Transcript_8173/g.22604 Transcript_8173/m.22604 type:complete len:900 (-) Transcript_8173:91-2790(-)